MAAIKTLKDIPSLTQLYRQGILRASNHDDLPAPNQEFNDKVCTLRYDITKLEVDAIVNAANTRMLGGGGVDGAIHSAAGPGLLEECKTLGGCETGLAKVTKAYDLPSKKVIHAVGPIYRAKEADNAERALRGCYKSALQLAVEHNCKSIAFCAISTGIYGYPNESAGKTAIREVRKFLSQPEGQKLDKVIFCNFLEKDIHVYAKILP